MAHFPIFLTLVLVVRNQGERLTALLGELEAAVRHLVSDYEIILIDNASIDDSLRTLKQLTGESGLANLQVFALTKEVDSDTAAWAGLENALGDFVAVIDPLREDIGFLPEMLDQAGLGADVVFATNRESSGQGLVYRLCYALFNQLYRHFNGIHLAKDAPPYRLLSRRVINFILQHPAPAIAYRHLPATGGFARVNLAYSHRPREPEKKRLIDSIDRGMQLLVSTTRGPMRLVTSLSLFGAVANVIYSIYVILIAIFKTNVAPGWITLSLQQSGMFLLISLVLLVLGEYILQSGRLSSEGPPYHIAQELTSAIMTRRQRLNVEVVAASAQSATSEPELAGVLEAAPALKREAGRALEQRR